MEASSPTLKYSRAALGAVALAFQDRFAYAEVPDDEAALRSDGTPLWLVSPHLNMMDDSQVECGCGVTGGLCVTMNPNVVISFAASPVCEIELMSGFGCDPDLRSVLNPNRGPTLPADTSIKSLLVPL